MSTHFYEPAEGHRLPHNPFKAIVAPRPIGWIGSRGVDGVNNLAPYSFFNAFSDEPPIVGFCSIGRKDTLQNAEASGEFTWNLASYNLAEQMNTSSAGLAPDHDEFALAGLTAVVGEVVAAPRVAEAGVSFECRTTQIVQLQDTDGHAHDRWLLLGQVVGVHIQSSLLLDGEYQTAKARPIMRGGGPADYFVVSENELFKMHRPKNAGL
ncbi:MAG: flavin reductase family protein [Granulosicoccaceae bacterium]